MKKLLPFFSALIALLLAAGVCASAAEPAKYTQLLVLGDSISTGYGLDNYIPGGDPYACQSYGNLTAAALGLSAKTTYINKAVNGDRSADLKALLPTISSVAAKSDLILISIGGNDVLCHLMTVASILAGRSVTSYEEAIPALVSADMSAYAALAENQQLKTLMETSLTGYAANMTEITALLRQYAPNARVIFLEQYNPMAISGSPIAAMLGDMAAKIEAVSAFASPYLDRINSTMREKAAAAGYETADVPAVINQNPLTLTNIMKMDIHPSAAGHREIFRVICEKLGIDPNPAPTETSVPTDPTVPTEHVHTFGEWTQTENAACVEGARVRVCSSCGFIESELIAPTAAHNYADGICTVCGAKDPEYTGAVGTETESTPTETASPASETAGSDTEAPKKDGGCGSLLALPVFFLAALSSLAYRKKDN